MTDFFKNRTNMYVLSILMKFGNGLIILPLVLYSFDLNNQSLWFILSVINGSILIADSGFSPTLIRSVSYLYGGLPNLDSFNEENQNTRSKTINFNELSDLLATFNVLYLIIGLLGSLLVFPLGFYMTNGISSLLDTEIIEFCLILLSAKFFFSILSVKYFGILQGVDRLALQKRNETLLEAIRIIALTITLFASTSIIFYFFVDLAVSIFGFIIYRRLTFIQLGKLKEKFWPGFYFSKRIFNFLWPSTWKYGLMQYGSFFSNQANALVLTQLPEPLIISSYLFTQKVVNILRQISQSNFNAYLPNIYNLFANNQISNLVALVSNKIVKSLGWFIIFITLLLFFGQFTLDLINISTPLLENSILIIMCVSMLLELHHSMHAQIYISSNKVPFLVPAIYTGIMIFFISSRVISSYGIVGIVLTHLFVQLSLNNWYPVYKSLSLLNLKFNDYLKIFKVRNIYESLL